MSLALPQTLVGMLEARLGDRVGHTERIVSTQPVTGGCIHDSLDIRTERDGRYFLKWSRDSTAEAFSAEADGLQALAGVGPLRVPEVIGYSLPDEAPSWLLLEFIAHGASGVEYWEALGTGLAGLHRATEGLFGWERPNFIGSLPQTNHLTEEWDDFLWERRLLPQITLALDAARLPGKWSEWMELESKLHRLIPADLTEPSLLHGDLWSGNVFPDPSGRPVLVDPAVYRGHSEVDLAMTRLFGGFPEAFYSAYRSVRPWLDGYEIRLQLYQLYPLLVHVNLFGGSYVDSTAGTLRKLLAHI